MKKIKMIDLFAGCGGLTEGFLETGKFDEISSIEWLKPQVNTLRNRLSKKWGLANVDQTVMHFDIQRDKELFSGWDDVEFGDSKGLDYYVNKANGIDIIIGGPPCQAYSIAGRVRDQNNMKDDYRNYLFEHYLKVVNRYRPKLFVFENVPGILSSSPSGRPITQMIEDGFASIGYEIAVDLKQLAIVNASDYGVPQNRNRVIIIGLDKNRFSNSEEVLRNFYTELLPKYKTNKKKTVRQAIGDLPKCMPILDMASHQKRISHKNPECDITWHKPRFSNLRDMDTFHILANDILTGKNEFGSKQISELYERKIGSKSPIHRYHVLKPDEPSTTIIAHLHKDGNRFIHYDPEQKRTITVREAARLQSFPDDFEFIGGQGSAYQMIGNAVPPLMAKAIAYAVYELLKENGV